ncbi:magnesium/cobalt transporter CorA [Oscillatoria acuminata]|uniref:Magnesium transport protein CorA n=1 Tax=Oscillatoria acuminata PCC 6304 TaxID=56110 RepID=K9TF25_9CYAN|nr:magnesium/cobalt transporter CorA [Oscillatoria acuminata]AFY81013.1 magnesium Mg(2+) and cobalt Co(2+) transport protein CorA [Oscillatoria acuminata PCC 6304]
MPSLPSVSEGEKNKHEESYLDYYYDEPGSIPGTLIIEEDAVIPTIVAIDYCEDNSTRVLIKTPEECIPYLDSQSMSWLDVQGLGSEAILQGIGTVFHLHPLLLEDIVNVPQRPKVEDYEGHLVIIARMVMLKEHRPDPTDASFISEQVSFVLGKSYLLTVQEEPEHDCFDTVRDRIRTNKGAIRKQGADYLAYTLLDAIIDGFFPVLEAYGERMEALESEVVANPSPHTLKKIYKIKRELLTLRRAIWPQRNAINRLIRDGSPLISDEVRIYLRDCYDHTIQVLDIVETYRELAGGLMEVYLSSISNQTNEVMKLLTVVSSIFIPLTFIVGVYGMNFNPERSPWNMPELNSYWGYPSVLAVMMAIAIVMIFLFWRRGWFNTVSSNHPPGQITPQPSTQDPKTLD